MAVPLTPNGAAGRKIVTEQLAFPEANAGLIWDRYLPIWNDRDPRPERQKPLNKHLRDFANQRNAAGAKAVIDLLLSDRAERFQRALNQLARSRQGTPVVLEFQLVWRLASGLGGSHPTENGFSFDVVGGVPYLPGSTVKGLCRRAVQLPGVKLGSEDIERLFGPEKISPGHKGFKGELTFFDAHPKAWPRLGIDIINSHHSEYYGNSTENRMHSVPPRETDQPNPVFFLAVEKNARFLFPILTPSETVASKVTRLLELGLDWLGIGAKTAAGYGVFKRIPPD